MRVLPILFNGDMVRAILDGRKTVTRRIVKKQPEISLDGTECECRHEKGFYDMGGNNWACRQCGYGVIPMRGGSWIHASYQPGDILYIRETWDNLPVNPDGSYCGYDRYYYRADGDLRPEGWQGNWKPSIHMGKHAARIWIKVTDARVERLQDITDEQILREGANFEAIKHYIAQMPEKTEEWIHAAHTIEFSQIWDSTIKKSDLDRYGWDASPWVWVIEFERCEKPEEV